MESEASYEWLIAFAMLLTIHRMLHWSIFVSKDAPDSKPFIKLFFLTNFIPNKNT